MAKKTWNAARGGRRPALATPRCENCPPKGPRCSPCRSTRRREVYATKAGRQRGPGTSVLGIPHMRCDACRETTQCKACYNAQRIARRAAREAIAVKEPPRERARSGQKPTIPRCPDCPQYGRPCHTCFRRHRNAMRAAKRGATAVKAPGLVRIRAPREVSAEQKAARAEALAAKNATAETLRKAREQHQAQAVAAGLLAEIQRETRLSVCQVCQTRGRWPGNFCRRHQEAANVPAGWGGTQKRDYRRMEA